MRALALLAAGGALAAGAPSSPARREGYEFFARLHAAAASGRGAAALEKDIPGLRSSLKEALAVSRRHWTDSLLVDEGARAEILEPKVLKALGVPVRGEGAFRRVPAGLMHAYGYLFSQLKTPYGLKGKRWIESRLDERLGLPAGSFGPFAPEGEFLSNLTAALFELTGDSIRPRRAQARRVRAAPAGVLEQRVSWRTPGGRLAAAVVATHLVPLAPLDGAPADEKFLLIYSVETGGRRRLVTAFPVSEGFASSFFSAGPSKGSEFKPRFNLFLDPAWKTASAETAGWRAAPRR